MTQTKAIYVFNDSILTKFYFLLSFVLPSEIHVDVQSIEHVKVGLANSCETINIAATRQDDARRSRIKTAMVTCFKQASLLVTF